MEVVKESPDRIDDLKAEAHLSRVVPLDNFDCTVKLVYTALHWKKSICFLYFLIIGLLVECT
ncbi:hypothetical protein BVRB_003950 [Beta vulgaris subsp. vulgaris]|uniref:Uncharacterized protein n=1 Tax=Beta vulgaris subsp. vulgaris TaxID=3555 RepID=A0A0J8B7Y9_BETVV|nr:hypothetical protein BVRB_003950 [Beta vulgaris subsp. vulgaris]